MSRLRGSVSLGRGEMMSTNIADDDERVAETWILAGGSWKKRQEAAAAAAAASPTNTPTPPSSPFRNRVVGKLQPPRASSRNQASSQRSRSNGRAPPASESSFHTDGGSVTSRTLSRDDSFRSRTSDTRIPRSVSSGRARSNETPPFLRSSSGLSSGVSSKASNDTKRSTRTSQTEPARFYSASNSSAASVSASSTTRIPEVVVEGKKRRSSKKTNNSWLQEKDSFFSATRHSESVKNSIQSRQSSSAQNRRPSLDASTLRSSQTEESSRIPMEKDARSSASTTSSSSSSKELTVTPPKSESQPTSLFVMTPGLAGTPMKEYRSASRERLRMTKQTHSKAPTTTTSPTLVQPSDEKEAQSSRTSAKPKDESFDTVQTSNTSERDVLSKPDPPRKFDSEEIHPRHFPQRIEQQQQDEKIPEGWATEWSDEKKESEPPLHPHVVEAFRDNRAIDVLAIDVLAIDVEPSQQPRIRHPTKSRAFSPSPLDQLAKTSFATPKKDPVRSPDSAKRKVSQRPVKSTSPESNVPVLTAEDLLAEEKGHGNATKQETGIPLSHVTAIRQCFGFDCDIYKDVLQVGRNATDRQLRIACFRRGRSILAEHHQLVKSSKESTPESVLKKFSNETKVKFQAISLAYEVIDNPEWRALYDNHGWDAPPVDAACKKSTVLEKEQLRNNHTPPLKIARASRQQRSRTVEPRSRSTTPILRPTPSDDDERRSRSTGRGIRWSEQVEELVFRQDPEELEARRVRSPPPPDPSIFDEEWMPEEMEDTEPSFMANILSEFDQSLDGLEASLDGFMKRGFEDWSMSSKGSKGSSKGSKGAQSEKSSTKSELRDTNSPISVESEASSSWDGTVDTNGEDDTIPSKLTENGLRPSADTENRSPGPEDWNAVGSLASTIPSTIHPEEDSEDVAVKQLFKVLTQTTDDRKKREVPCSEPVFKVEKHRSDGMKIIEDPCNGTRSTEVDSDRLSPSDVRKMPTEEDSVVRAFSGLNKDYRNASMKIQKDADFFDPFDDSVSSLNIGDGDFGSPVRGFQQLASKLKERDSPKEQRRASKECPVIVEDVTSVSSSPERRTEIKVGIRLENNSSPPVDHLFSQPVPEFEEASTRIPLRTQIVDTTDFRRAKSDFSSLSGITSTFNTSVKTDHILISNRGHQRFCSLVAPVAVDHVSTSNRPAAGRTNDGDKSSEAPCDMDFFSQMFCYTNALSGDLDVLSNELSSKITETRNMILESLTFTDDDVRSVVSAMDLPHVERSNTM
eukprot:scaffold611_cov133-Amphora_coffeaeformis.AAC.1